MPKMSMMSFKVRSVLEDTTRPTHWPLAQETVSVLMGGNARNLLIHRLLQGI